MSNENAPETADSRPAVGGPVERGVRPQRGDSTATFERDGAKRWQCMQCNKEHVLGPYVFAHWDDDLQHTCDCGHKHSVLRGHITYLGA